MCVILEMPTRSFASCIQPAMPMPFSCSSPCCSTHSAQDLVIYEMPVRSFTASSSSGLPSGVRGTFLGVAEKVSVESCTGPGLGRWGREAVALTLPCTCLIIRTGGVPGVPGHQRCGAAARV